MNWMTNLTINAAPATPPAMHPMVAELRAAARRFAERTDSFAAGKAATCSDIATKLGRHGTFASDKQAEYARKLVEWSKPRQTAQAGAGEAIAGTAKAAQSPMLVPSLYAVLQRHTTFHAGEVKLSRRNGDTLCWIMWGQTCVGKIENAAVTLFTGRLAKFPATGGVTVQAAIEAVLREFDADPLAAAVRYGKLSGTCCSCGRDLTDPASIEAGIGPVCAQKFGYAG